MTPPARRAFLSGLIDYAGLFPPAELAVEPALDLYGRYRSGDDAWMLGRFLVPAARLADVGPLLAGVEGAGPVRFSVLGGAPPVVGHGPTSAMVVPEPSVAWLTATEAVIQAARAFEEEHRGQAVCDAFEVRVPAPLARDVDALSGALGALVPRLAAGRSRLALEVPFVDAPDATEPASHAIADANGRAGRAAFAVKFRCGGEAVPSAEALAGAVTSARQAGVAFKATAGLHHPLRHTDVTGADAHGFLNLFGGAVLASVHGLGADDLAEVLDSRDASAWLLGDTLGWRTLRARPEQVAEARERFALAYGSCSFDEPRDDLRALDWL
jgi:hypothetical protein